MVLESTWALQRRVMAPAAAGNKHMLTCLRLKSMLDPIEWTEDMRVILEMSSGAI
jgi:hypothetical protein